MLCVENVSKKFGSTVVLQDVSFAVKSGTIVAILGENGAGKSTLLRLISGFYEPDSGKISISNLTLKQNRPQYLARLAYVPETPALYSNMTVYDFLHFAAGVHKVSVGERCAKIKHLVEILSLQNVLMQKNETLSKGYKKRLELAAALIGEPDLLLLDEPTEGLDPNQKQVLRNLIKQYAQKHMVIISTHSMEDVESLAKQVLLLHKGKILMNTDLAHFKQTADNNLLHSFRKLTDD